MKIEISARGATPATKLYCETHMLVNSKLEDRPVMLLVPGGPGGNHTVYNSIKDELLRFCNLVLFDPRGCGYSDPSETKYCSLAHYIEDIEAIRQHFGLTKIVLLGGSYGAMASIGYALKYGDNIEKLILIAGAPSYRFLDTAKKNLYRRGTPKQIRAAQHLFNGTFRDPDHFREYYETTSSLYLFSQPPRSGYLPTVKQNVPYNTAVTNFGFGDFLRKFDFEEELQRIECATLIIVGKQDWINDPIHAKTMSYKMPNAQLVELENCGHFIWVDQPQGFLQALNGFMIETKSFAFMRSSL